MLEFNAGVIGGELDFVIEAVEALTH